MSSLKMNAQSRTLQGRRIMNTKTIQHLAYVFAIVFSTLLSGCFGGADDISRVQPNVVSKDIFDGEWYMGATVVEKQYASAMLFEGLQDELRRIRWEVTEDTLFGYLTYEQVIGTDVGNAGDRRVAIAFPIESHFDIRRQYNVANGVENNVIEENTNDRPWWEREFMRVDWSSYAGPSEIYGGLTFGGMVKSMSKVNFDRNSGDRPSNPWRPRITKDYVETTISSVLSPDPAACQNLDKWGGLSCEGIEAQVKFSFMRVPEEQTYDALEYYDSVQGFGFIRRIGNPNDPSERNGGAAILDNNNREMECGPDTNWILVPGCTDSNGNVFCFCDTETLLTWEWPQSICDPAHGDVQDCYKNTDGIWKNHGFFRTQRHHYDRERGATVTGRKSYVQRFNLWENAYDENGDKLDYKDRTPKKLTFYTNAGYPDFMQDAVGPLADEWNTVFSNAVAAAKGTTRESLTNDFGAMFEIVDNTCNRDAIDTYISEYDSKLKLREALVDAGIGLGDGEDFESSNLGVANMEKACAVLEDAGRRHLEQHGVILVANKDSGELEYTSYLGKTAEITPDEVFAWEQIGDVRYSHLNWAHKPEVAGPLGYGPAFADPVTGEIISANANMYGASVMTYAEWAGDVIDLMNGNLEFEDLINGTQIRDYIEGVSERAHVNEGHKHAGEMLRQRHEAHDRLSDAEYFRPMPLSAVGSNFRKVNAYLSGSEEYNFEDEFLVSADMEELFSRDAAAFGQDEKTARMKARPSSWNGRSVPDALVQLHTHGNYHADRTIKTVEGGIQSDVERMKARDMFFGKRNFCYFESDIEPGVASLAARMSGLPRDEAVKLIRDNIFIGVAAHELGHNMGLRHNFSGSVDALNFFPGWWGLDEIDYTKTRYDRSGDSDLEGLTGAPTLDAVRDELAYSSIMDYHQEFNSDWGGVGLYDQATINMGYVEMVEIFDEDANGDGLVLPSEEFYPDDIGTWNFTYEHFPALFSGQTNLINSAYDEAVYGRYNGDQTAIVEPNQIPGIEEKPENMYKRRYVKFSDYLAHAENWDRVPYDFCTDEWAGGGNVTCNRFDKGATLTQIVLNNQKMYDIYHPFYTYLGARSSDPAGSWMSRLYGRYLDPSINTYRFFYFFRRSIARFLPVIQDWSSASHVGLNFVNKILQTPEPGTYCLDGGVYVPEAEVSGACASSMEVDRSIGRELQSKYTNQQEMYLPKNVGHVYDKLVALQAITSNDAFFYQNFSDILNPGAFNIGFYRTFAPELEAMLLGMMTDTTSPSAYRYMSDGTIEDTPLIVYDEEIRCSFPDGGDNLEDYPDCPTGGTFAPAPTFSGTPIKPSNNRWLKIYSIFYSMLGYSSIYDSVLDLGDRSRITIDGSGNDPTRVGANFIPVTFTDPRTGVTYKAYDFSDGRGNFAATLLQEAQDFVDNVYTGATGSALEDAERELEDMLGLIDFMKMLSDALEYSN